MTDEYEADFRAARGGSLLISLPVTVLFVLLMAVVAAGAAGSLGVRSIPGAVATLLPGALFLGYFAFLILPPPRAWRALTGPCSLRVDALGVAWRDPGWVSWSLPWSELRDAEVFGRAEVPTEHTRPLVRPWLALTPADASFAARHPEVAPWWHAEAGGGRVWVRAGNGRRYGDRDMARLEAVMRPAGWSGGCRVTRAADVQMYSSRNLRRIGPNGMFIPSPGDGMNEAGVVPPVEGPVVIDLRPERVQAVWRVRLAVLAFLSAAGCGAVYFASGLPTGPVSVAHELAVACGPAALELLAAGSLLVLFLRWRATVQGLSWRESLSRRALSIDSSGLSLTAPGQAGWSAGWGQISSIRLLLREDPKGDRALDAASWLEVTPARPDSGLSAGSGGVAVILLSGRNRALANKADFALLRHAPGGLYLGVSAAGEVTATVPR